MSVDKNNQWPVTSIPDDPRELDADWRVYLRELADQERAKRPASYWDQFDIEAVGAALLMLTIALAAIVALLAWAHG